MQVHFDPHCQMLKHGNDRLCVCALDLHVGLLCLTPADSVVLPHACVHADGHHCALLLHACDPEYLVCDWGHDCEYDHAHECGHGCVHVGVHESVYGCVRVSVHGNVHDCVRENVRGSVHGCVRGPQVCTG